MLENLAREEILPCVSGVFPADDLDMIESRGGGGVPRVQVVVCQQLNLQHDALNIQFCHIIRNIII